MQSSNDKVVVNLSDIFKNGNLAEVKHFYKKHPLTDITVDHFWAACEYGYLDIAQWIIQTNIELNLFSFPKKKRYDAFYLACKNGHIAIAQWLLEINHASIDSSLITLDYDLAFRYASENGHLDIAKWIFKIRYISNDYLEFIFIIVCSKGHLDIAQWLLQTNPRFDISEDNEGAFKGACGNGHLEVAQWLLQIKPDIYNDEYVNEYAFIAACENNQLEVIYWLQSTHMYYYSVEIVNNKIVNYLVRTLEERKWEERKLVLASHLNGQITELFYGLPYDVVRNICMYV